MIRPAHIPTPPAERWWLQLQTAGQVQVQRWRMDGCHALRIAAFVCHDLATARCLLPADLIRLTPPADRAGRTFEIWY